MSEVNSGVYFAEQSRLKQIAVFGAERMEMVEGHEAGVAITQDLITTVETLCAEAEERYRNLGGTFTTLRRVDTEEIFDELITSFNPTSLFTRQIPREGSLPLNLHVNPDDMWGFGSTDVDRAPASVYPLVPERRLLRPKGFMPMRYDTHEKLFVDHEDGRAKILRVIETNHYAGFFGYAGLCARKLATEAEVDEALNTIAVAIQAETEANPAILDDSPQL
jgi:hypothetical protein